MLGFDLKSSTISGATLVPAARTASGNGTAVLLNDAAPLVTAILNVGTVSGTGPTLDVKMQSSPDNSTWTDITGATFTQVIASTSRQVINFILPAGAAYVRAVTTIAGTNSPTFNSSCDVFTVESRVASSGNEGGFSRSPSA